MSGNMTSDAGALLQGEIESNLVVIKTLANCIHVSGTRLEQAMRSCSKKK
jgi:hypothetical protein